MSGVFEASQPSYRSVAWRMSIVARTPQRAARPSDGRILSRCGPGGSPEGSSAHPVGFAGHRRGGLRSRSATIDVRRAWIVARPMPSGRRVRVGGGTGAG